MTLNNLIEIFNEAVYFNLIEASLCLFIIVLLK